MTDVDSSGIAEVVGGPSERTLRIDLAWYDRDAIQPAVFAFTDRLHVLLESASETEVVLRLRTIDGTPVGDGVIGDLGNALLDHTLRARLRRETAGIRAVLVAQAFSRTDLLRPAAADADAMSDPQGIGQPDTPHAHRS